MNAPASTTETTALAVADRQQFDLSPRNFEEALTFAGYMAESELVPKDFKGKASNCLIAIQWGAELGLKPLQAVQNIAIINGRPSLWGDVMLALVRSSALCEYVVETFDGAGESLKAICKVKRRGEPEQVREFSCDDAKQAGLLGKDGPWKQYRKRMLQMRARGWALRDVFTDVLKGLYMAEEAIDMPPPEKHMGPAEIVPPSTTQTTELPAYPEADFEKNLPTWRKAIEGKKKTADDVIATVETKGRLTDAQKARIRGEQANAGADVQDAKPKVTYAHVATLLNAAKNADELAAAGDLIAQVGDEQQRGELQVLFDGREAAFRE